MKLSTRGRYGLRAMIDIAQYSGIQTVSISDICKRPSISESYLEQIIAVLKKSGLLVSKRGAGDGYLLTRPMEEISVGDILRALEGGLEPVECPALKEESGCRSADTCVTKYVWKRINDSINDTVDKIMLSELVDTSIKVSDNRNESNSDRECCKKQS